MFNSPDEVVLSEELTRDLMLAAFNEARLRIFQNNRATHGMWQARKAKRAMSLLDANNLRFDTIRRGRRLTIDGVFDVSGYYGDLLSVLCYYFTADQQFELSKDQFEADCSLRKGILLRGPVGCRKTTLLRLLSDNPRAPFAVVEAAQIKRDYEKMGASALDHWINFNEKPLLIDDIGVGTDTAFSWGNVSSAALDVVSGRDALQERGRLPRGSTHATTNLSEAEMLRRFGERFTSRLRAMCNSFEFPADSLDYRR